MRAVRPLLFVLALMATFPAGARAVSPLPVWSIYGLAAPANFEPGGSLGETRYEIAAINSGADHTDQSPIILTDTLPQGQHLDEANAELLLRGPTLAVDVFDQACEVAEPAGAEVITCTIDESLSSMTEPALLWPGESVRLIVPLLAPTCFGGASSCPLVNRAEIQGGNAAPATIETSNEINSTPAPSGFQFYRPAFTAADGSPVSQAAGRGYQYTTAFAVNLERTPPGFSKLPFIPAAGDLKDVNVKLPPGFVGNPTAIERCTAREFTNSHEIVVEKDNGLGGNAMIHNECPDSSAVGYAVLTQIEGEGTAATFPIYNLEPPPGMPAQLGFLVYPGVPIYIDTSLRTGGDYGIDAHVRNTTEAKRITAASLSIWGTPAAPDHDRMRGTCLSQNSGNSLGDCPAGIPIKPFFRMPTSCALPLLTTMAFDTWTAPGAFVSASSSESAPDGCNALDFSPTIEAQPTTKVADSPSGLHFDLHIPQSAHESPDGPGEADLRDATVTLPQGLVVNPSSADGLGACSEAQVGYTGMLEGRPSFTAEPANCPDTSKIGTVTVKTPLLDHPLPGAVYLAEQNANPFDSLLAIYITVNDPQSGVVVKLAGEVHPDPRTGQLSTTVKQSPQLPFEDFELNFFEGPRAPLRTPASCGTHTTNTALVPWSAPEGPSAFPSDSFAIDRGPGGGCPSGALQPHLSAGLQDTAAGTYSPFSLRLTRDDGTAELAGLTTTPPPGFTAKLAGIPYCSEAGIGQAKGREHPGGGRQELSQPSCPSASQVGRITAGAGAGPNPFYVAGKLYLAGPYKGAPISLVAIIPAVAGPFDLGTVVNRVASYVDLETAQIRAVADPLPTILSGIPVDTRDLRVDLDRPGFTLAPTNCEPMALGADVLGTNRQGTSLSNRFQVGDCKRLKFKPKLKLRLKGATKRSGHPALRAVVTTGSTAGCTALGKRARSLSRKAKQERRRARGAGGAKRSLRRQANRHARQARKLRQQANRCLLAPSPEANIAGAQVGLPHSEFLDQGNLDKVCKQAELKSATCPKRSIYGRAKAWTPLLDKPLEGPVYIGVGYGHKLPDLVADLNGQVRILLHGRVDTTKHEGIRNTFEVVPDAPVSRFVLEMKGGKKYGLLENSENICKKTQRASALFKAQNGLSLHLQPVIRNDCGKHRKRRKGQGKHERAKTQGAAEQKGSGRR